MYMLSDREFPGWIFQPEAVLFLMKAEHACPVTVHMHEVRAERPLRREKWNGKQTTG